MPDEFLVSLSRNSRHVAMEDVKQFVVIRALKKMLYLQEDVAIESHNETLEDCDEWVLSENSDGFESDNEKTNDSGFESDKESGERVEEYVN